jgi:peroxiredoxin
MPHTAGTAETARLRGAHADRSEYAGATDTYQHFRNTGRTTAMKNDLDGAIAPLAPGTVAPDLSLPHTPRVRLALHELRGQPVVLAFYPMDWEPVSREQLTLYEAYAPAFDRLGAGLLGISVDHVHSHQTFVLDAKLHFPLLADVQPRGAVARQYGVFREAEGVSACAIFVLDARCVIHFSKAYPEALNPGVDGLLTTLEQLAAEGNSDGTTRER